MRMFETLFIKMSDGTSRWLSEDQTKQSSLSGELRIVAKADEGNAFMLDGEILGEQIWLRESIDASNLLLIPLSVALGIYLGKLWNDDYICEKE